MASIYEIPDWSSSTASYAKNDVVIDGAGVAGSGRYATYALQAINPNNSSTQPNYQGSLWGGLINYDNKVIPHFFWVPSYAPSFSNEPMVRSVKFGDGYEQRTPEGINSNLLKISLNFDKRDESETKAISHFLHSRGGSEAFAYLPPSPYSSMKKFICKKWNVTMNFENNYSIQVDLEEVVE